MTASKQSQDGTAPKLVEFYNRINLNNQCVWLVIKKKTSRSDLPSPSLVLNECWGSFSSGNLAGA
jgi:hypothetical protein